MGSAKGGGIVPMDPIARLQELMEAAALPSTSLELKRNEFLKTSGSIDTRLYYIDSGSLRIFFEDEFEEHTIRLGYTGNFIASLDSFISEKPSDLYIQAIKKCRVTAYKKKDYTAFLSASIEAKEIWNSVNEWLIYQQIEREKDILIQSPKARYKRVLERSPRLFQEIPLKYIASYLRMTPETLSRLRNS